MFKKMGSFLSFEKLPKVSEQKKKMAEQNGSIKLAIHHDDQGKGTLYRLKKNSMVHVHPGPSLLGRRVAIFCNYPADGKEFDRNRYIQLKWFSPTGTQLDTDGSKYLSIRDIDYYCNVHLTRSGAYHFYILYEGQQDPQAGLYVQVEPTLTIGKGPAAANLPLEAIRCQTVISKLLGPVQTWEAKLQVAKESGYNMIHFTPIQELGGSRSAYSLKNQLAVNPEFQNGDHPVKFDDVEKVIKKMRDDWGIVSICDIVLNHTANESIWIREYAECSYNCFTSPHLRPAFLLDALLARVGEDVAAGLLEHVGVPKVVETNDHLQAIRWQVHSSYLPQIKLYELYQCDVDKYIARFNDEASKQSPTPAQEVPEGDLKLKHDPEYRRLGAQVDFARAMKTFNVFRQDCFDEDSRKRKCTEAFRGKLQWLNEEVRKEIQAHLDYAIENCLAGTRYERVQADGPQVKGISVKYPLFMKYFTQHGIKGKSLKEIEEMMYGGAGKLFMAHNGWVINSDPLKDFARPQEGTGNVYLRRELIAWGDSVKLRYGDKPEDSPYLWKHMKEYVDTTARIFDGVRLDNCHSTPLHVAEYLLDSARKVNPELYVVAELFTNSDYTDNIFVNRLGITSLIREALSAWDSHEEGRLVHRYGGDPVGAFFPYPKRILAPSIAHALFMDLTHDNPSPVEKRSIFDLIPSAGLVSMACCATGSNRGYDELVPHHIHVVDEERQYQEWGKHVDKTTGIVAVKEAFNLLHGGLSTRGFDQLFVDQMNPDIVAVTRHSTQNHETVILVAHTAFSYPSPWAGPTGVRPLRFEGDLLEIIFEVQIYKKTGQTFDQPTEFKKDEHYINGVKEYVVDLRKNLKLEESDIFRKQATIDGNTTQLDFVNLKPGSVVAVRVALKDNMKPHFDNLHSLVREMHQDKGSRYAELQHMLSKLDLVDFNNLLYCCAEEERDNGGGPYTISGYGDLVYCGLQGVVSILSDIGPNNDLGHPLANNLRMGNWLIDYCSQRLLKYSKLVPVATWLEKNLAPLKEIPRYMIPSYFDVIITGVHRLAVNAACQLMTDFVRHGSNFGRRLALGSVQCVRVAPSANLPALSPNITPPKPPQRCSTLAAGLPHFATGYMRCWGRDTFISLRGLMFLTGRFDEARYMILGFGHCLRHGLIPNLLDGGMNARFNCRDAVWWWLYCVRQYVEEAPNGKNILKDKVSRLYPTDDSDAKMPGECDQFLYETIQEALVVHFQGLSYRERNAGTRIDAHMKDKGFNNRIGIHPETGFVFGGNNANCGTWMDKMGSSDKSGNRGVPSSPRDGSAVELVGLQMAGLRFMQRMAEEKVIPFNSVERKSSNGTKTVWTYKQWADKIAANFEKEFYVDESCGSQYVNKKGMYKDTLGSEIPWTDYQLRCNFPIALVAAPELCDPKHAWRALENAKKYLLGPLGMKTLDCEDWGYRGNYDNSIDSDDKTVAHGANYHNGPEWVWPIGFYLRARLIFAKANGLLKETIAETWSILQKHLHEVQTNHWRGLAELTNENGAYCNDSCRTQAWSMGCVLEVLHDLEKYEKEL
ncbi:glycogen debranching enzyme isoform X1 [Ochlerotatus camptorhynchus]|uniref:glycogen debranching enzyme isoform X1 n=2 Tax=Ochlerotatus camptorhynchus TaxID=644619 RepID=UPI0031D7761C